MCSAKEWIQSPSPSRCNGQQKQQQQPLKRSKVRVQRLIIRRRSDTGKDMTMKLKNLKLYLENRSILEENEKLRQKALRLRQENLALLSEFQKKFNSSQLGGSNFINQGL